MANFDAGHYFLTMLAPVKAGMSEVNGKPGFSYRQTVLDSLAKLKNSETSVTSRGTPEASPFARNTMTHLARFALIDAPPYNGREGGDTLLTKLFGGGDPTVHQPVDTLGSPYLLFAADFDATDGSDASLRRFTDTLWATMRDELAGSEARDPRTGSKIHNGIFAQCYGFDEVRTAEDFFQYVKKCQVETTMPFNDYWRPGAPIPGDMTLPILDSAPDTGGPKIPWLQIGLGALAVWVLCLFGSLFLREGSAALHVANWVARWGLLAILVALAGLGAFVWSLYSRIMARGAQVFPPGATLPDVLKSLYLQQAFLEFVIQNQGRSDAALQAEYGKFVAACAPENETWRTQFPGVIRTPDAELTWPPPPGRADPVPPPAAAPAPQREGAVA
ncbi:hypothetical protein [Paracraurococcus ruber]|uniref:Uncharacterized protein n=1 Tax=Paracraurococcus ruber TaxID=77675 RepID=A0ABS1D2Z2_9PROT|nr:hypothetical protein [Paracraurococcus ruber]MBK1660858.1 hypothetical protein [Paracraurococcus ruber]TDG19283.1 hypothetical protein E2C05_27620 [Paracraurococcus ruber]